MPNSSEFDKCDPETFNHIERAYELVITSKLKQQKAQFKTKLEAVMRDLKNLKKDKLLLMNEKQDLKDNVDKIYGETFNEFKGHIMKWTAKLQSERDIFDRKRREDDFRQQRNDKIEHDRELDFQHKLKTMKRIIASEEVQKARYTEAAPILR